MDPNNSDDDLFMKRSMKHVSMAEQLANSETIEISDDDDDDIPPINVFEKLPRKKRGRPGRKGPAQDSSSPKKPKVSKSVFDTTPGQKICDVSVDADEEDVAFHSPAVRDEVQLAAHRAVMQAKAMSALADEAVIEAEAEANARANAKREELGSRRAVLEVDSEVTVVAQPARPVHLKVRSQDKGVKGSKPMEARYRIRMTDPVVKVLRPFCENFKLDYSTFYVEVDGERVTENCTPESLDLEDDMLVEVKEQ